MKTGERAAMQQFKNMLMQYDKIVLYGAGIWGEQLLDCIYEWRLYKKVVFAVTNADDRKEHMGIEVINIDSLKECNDKYIVVVSVGNALTDEMCACLNEKNIGPYISLNEPLRSALKEENRSKDVQKKVTEELVQAQKQTAKEIMQLQKQMTEELVQVQKQMTKEIIQLQKQMTEESMLLREVYQKLNRVESRIERLDVLTMVKENCLGQVDEELENE